MCSKMATINVANHIHHICVISMVNDMCHMCVIRMVNCYVSYVCGEDG
jgi:hypothetical protein